MDLERSILHLAKFGKPRLMMMDDGTWHCCVDVFVVGQGISFSVKSSYHCPNPAAAADECRTNLEAAFTDFATKRATLSTKE